MQQLAGFCHVRARFLRLSLSAAPVPVQTQGPFYDRVVRFHPSTFKTSLLVNNTRAREEGRRAAWGLESHAFWTPSACG